MAGYPRVTHPSATQLRITRFHRNSVRLACVKHAASVHPEPGSNSQINLLKFVHLIPASLLIWLTVLRFLFSDFQSRRTAPAGQSLSQKQELWALSFSLGIFRVALLFICQGSSLFSCDSFLNISRPGAVVNNFFKYLRYFLQQFTHPPARSRIRARTEMRLLLCG